MSGRNVAVVDYQMGNLRSVQKALERVGAVVQVTSDPHCVAAADRVVLPGVGACGDALNELKTRGLVDSIREVIARGRPFLGICLGLQMLFDVSYEGGKHSGLGILPGEVRRFPAELSESTATECDPAVAQLPHGHWKERVASNEVAAGEFEAACSQQPSATEISGRFKVPHMGWNRVQVEIPGCPLMEGLEDGTYFYFVHSYYVAPADPSVAWLSCHYGIRFCAAVWKDNLFATQFHPEKSQAAGLKMLENFVRF